MLLWNTQFRADLPTPLTYKPAHNIEELKKMGKLYIFFDEFLAGMVSWRGKDTDIQLTFVVIVVVVSISFQKIINAYA